MWTVVFCPKVGFYLGNVDTKIQNFDFGVHITKTQKKPYIGSVHSISMDTSVDSTCMSDVLHLSLTSCECQDNGQYAVSNHRRHSKWAVVSSVQEQKSKILSTCSVHSTEGGGKFV